MELTLFVSIALGLASLLLVIDGTACMLHVDQVCFLDRPSNIVMVIIGAAMLIPVLVTLFTMARDHYGASREERKPLLGTEVESAAELPDRLLVYLYASHFLSAWGDRMWAFAIPILLMEVFVDTLLPSACFSLVTYLACIIAIPSVGRYLDQANRWKAMQYAIVIENLMIVGSSTSLALIMLVTNADGLHKPEWSSNLMLLFVVTLICGGLGQILNNAQTLAIERDWVVVLSRDNSEQLATLNTTMRRIDLVCKILAPTAFGFIMENAGSNPTTRAMVGAAAVAVWNLMSLPLEYSMTRDIYHLNPELAIKEASEGDDGDDENNSKADAFKQYLAMWRVYIRHPTFLISFAFCALYMTILDGGALNTAYLKWRGVRESVLGASRGVGAVFGLIGTAIFPALRLCLGRLERVAVFSVWLFWLCLIPVVVAFLLAGESAVSDYTMLGSMVVSRLWLWCTDLSETQIMQEWIEPGKRGSINSMQTATTQLFYILIQVAGMVFNDPREFMLLVMISLATVLGAAVGFTAWDIKYGQRRHLYVRRHPHV